MSWITLSGNFYPGLHCTQYVFFIPFFLSNNRLIDLIGIVPIPGILFILYALPSSRTRCHINKFWNGSFRDIQHVSTVRLTLRRVVSLMTQSCVIYVYRSGVVSRSPICHLRFSVTKSNTELWHVPTDPVFFSYSSLVVSCTYRSDAVASVTCLVSPRSCRGPVLKSCRSFTLYFLPLLNQSLVPFLSMWSYVVSYRLWEVLSGPNTFRATF